MNKAAELQKNLVIKFANKIAALNAELAEAYVTDRYNVNRGTRNILDEITVAQNELRIAIIRLDEVTA